MTPGFEALLAKFLAKYGWILIGITFGFAAKYALLIKRGVPVKARLVFADLLLLPMVALIAYWMATRAGFEAEASALFSAFCAVGADRLVKLLTDRFLQRVDSEAELVANQMLGRARTVVANELAAESIIEAHADGRAPKEYAALKPHPQAPKKNA
ncbi:hypothetical protein CA233_19135 [Sphingomonas sp. ABOLD]|uniref:Uncharacterized protein n=1 Tax=Sphingomonas trueperi TaxID=53317 RepID=A0A7X5Y4R5_9SPHN|nr:MULTISPECIES: hypothetical protein [Sphingomonas]NJB99441.1 hypothetical protein [Sphingomonas trueperi]RSV35173.1 hypothetical protein CA234_20285 [Sphingomonas sp. ABOLE]RSV40954.1 hypothetical protein CA233_19135 [Sphingomonas sp. ABOLD]